MSIFDQPETERLLGNMIQPVTVFDPNPGHSSRAAREDHRHQLDPNILAGVGQGRQNLLDNGGFLVGQRALPITGAGFGFDRWAVYSAGIAVYSHAGSSLTPNGDFFASAVYTVTTADASIAAGDYTILQQGVEGYSIASLAYGTLNAKATVLSFWARASVAGTYCVAIRNGAGTRSYIEEFQLDAATWKKITVNIPGCTSGVWDTTSAVGAILSFSFAAGTTFQGTAKTWNIGNLLATANQVNATATISNSFNIVGVKWEIGSLATNYVYEDYSVDLLRCRRYLQAYQDPPLRGMVTGPSNGARMAMTLTSPMRAAPTLISISGATFGYDGVTGQQASLVNASYNTVNSVEHDITFIGAAWVAGRAVGIYLTGSGATWLYSAEI